MSRRDEALVAIMNDPHDWHYAVDDHWYRIPVSSVAGFLKRRWPPTWLAFYHTKAFGEEAFSIRHVGRVISISQVTRRQLLPYEPEGRKSDKLYYKLQLAALERLPRPIVSIRWRRITFIPTTLSKLETAAEINDLYDDSPLEDRLWSLLKPHNLPVIRQELVEAGGGRFILDFAVYCARGALGIEADGDTFHHTAEHAPKDNLRQNALIADGWRVLHFNTPQIMEQAETYCLPTILDTINELGGTNDSFVPTYVNPNPDSPRQLGLFDKPPDL